MSVRDTTVNLILRGKDYASDVFKRVANSSKSLFVSFSKLEAGGLELIRIFRRIAGSVVDWFKAALVQERAENKLASLLKTLTGATDEQIDALKRQASALQQATGYGDELIISMQSQLATFKLSAEQIGQLTPSIIDMAEAARRAGKESVDLESIALQVGKAFSGQVGSLSEYGVVLTDAQKTTVQFGSTQEKVNAVTEVLAENYGNLAEEIGDTYEGSLRKAGAAQGNFLEKLGSLVTESDAVKTLTNDVTKAFEALSAGLSDEGSTIRLVVDVIARSLSFLIGSIRIAFNTIQILFKGVGITLVKTAEVISTALSKITFGDLSDRFARTAENMRREGAKLAKSIEGDFDDLNDASSTVGRSLRAVEYSASGAGGSLGKIPPVIDDVVDGMGEGKDAADKYSSALELLNVNVDVLEGRLSESSKKLADAFERVSDSADSSGKVVVAAFKGAVEASGDLPTVKRLLEQLKYAFITGRITEEEYKEALGKLPPVIDDNITSLDDLEKATNEYDNALKLLNVDVQAAEGGISSASHGLVDAFGAITKSADASGKVIVTAFRSAFEEAQDLPTITRLVDDLKAAFDAGKISPIEYAKALEGVATKIGEIKLAKLDLDGAADSLKDMEESGRGAGEAISEAAEASGEVAAGAEDAGASWAALVNFVEGVAVAVGRTAAETTDGAIAAERVSDAFKEILKTINDQQPIGNFHTFMLNLARAGDAVEKSWRNQEAAYHDLLRRIELGTVDLTQAQYSVEGLRDQFGLLDETTLNGLISEVDRAQREIEGLFQSTEDSIKQLQDRIDSLNGDEAARINRQFQADLKQINEDIQNTQDATLRKRLQEEKQLLIELHELELAQLREREQQKKKTESAGGGGTSAAGGTAQGPATAPPQQGPQQDVTFNFSVPTFDEDTVRRYVIPILDKVRRLQS